MLINLHELDNSKFSNSAVIYKHLHSYNVIYFFFFCFSLKSYSYFWGDIMNLYFVRHGESECNILKVFSNRGLTHGLTEKGREQADSLSEKLKDIKFNAIYTSPLLRAIETAEILSKRLNSEYIIAKELIEFDTGILEGKSDNESWNRYWTLLDEWFIKRNWDIRIEDGESFNDIKNRMLPFIHNLKKIHLDGSNILLIGHGGTYRCIFPIILSNIDFAYSCMNHLDNTEYLLASTINDKFHCIQWGENIFEN